MTSSIRKVVIVGGGSAGWLTAGILAARFDSSLSVTLIESPDVKTIGVGEGTWPSMRTTLQKIGVSEADFIRGCDVSLKQGTKFVNWRADNNHQYYHPFSLPLLFGQIDLASFWQSESDHLSFANAVSPQAELCEKGLAAKQIQTPEYAFNVNYGYHLNAGKFADFLKSHCLEKLNVCHLLDHVESVVSLDNGDIKSLVTRNTGEIGGDLFIDCTGLSAKLIGEHFGIESESVAAALFNDRAYAVQVPYESQDSAIASCTHSTAKASGWIWDIGLPNRRGVGYVCSSAHTSDEQAEQELFDYLAQTVESAALNNASFRRIDFNPGYRRKFWQNNCVAIGLSAGFVEPLEASALVLVERAASAIADQFPDTHEAMGLLARRFNKRFTDHWQGIIEFLKLHYVLSNRSNSAYWLDHRREETIPPHLKEQLSLWAHQSPSLDDTPAFDELFPAASYQYVLYGMNFKTSYSSLTKRNAEKDSLVARKAFRDNAIKTKQLIQAMPTNRELIEKVHRSGFQQNQ